MLNIINRLPFVPSPACSLTSQLLASQEGFYSMALASYLTQLNQTDTHDGHFAILIQQIKLHRTDTYIRHFV
jgi:hypothetical protein